MSTGESKQADPFADVADEFVNEYRKGNDPKIEDYVARYPNLENEIRDLLPALIMMERVKNSDDSSVLGSEDPWFKLIGSQISDYRIIREIGRGGMGIVYEAEQLSLGRQVAIKILPRQNAMQTSQALRFHREAKAAARLHHTNIVPVFGVGEDEGLNYYVMQYIHGLGLDEVLDQLRMMRETPPNQADAGSNCRVDSLRSEQLAHFLLSGEQPCPANSPPAEAVSVAKPRSSERLAIESGITGGLLSERSESIHSSSVSRIQHKAHRGGSSNSSNAAHNPYWRNIARIGLQVSDALHYAHEQGISHRDIKPSNILLDMYSTAWVTDFGLAKAQDEANITRSGDILGTIRYMPPEAFEGEADSRGDIYALGITLYELATLKTAFSGFDRRQLIKQVTSGTPEPIAKVSPGTPRDFATIIGKAIERDPNDRYASAAELHEDLRRFLDDEPIRARRASAAERLSRWTRQNRALAAATFGVATLLSIIAIASFLASMYFLDQKEKQRALYDQAHRMAGSNALLLDKLEVALEDSVSSARAADSARDQAEKQSELTRRNLYSANMLDALTTSQGHRGLASVQSLLNRWGGESDLEDYRDWEWFYIQSLCHQYSTELSGHSAAVKAVAKEPGGTRFASISDDGEIRLWDLQTHELLFAFRTDVKRPRCLSWSTELGLVAAGGVNGFAVMELQSREMIYRSTKDAVVHGLSFSPNGQWLARLSRPKTRSPQPSIELLDTQSFQPQQTLPGNCQSLFGVHASWSADSKLFAYPASQYFFVWDAQRKKRVFSNQTPRHETMQSVRFHPTDVNRVATAARDGIVEVWNLKEHTVEQELIGHTHAISDVGWHPSGDRLATGSWDGSLRYWDASTGKQLRIINGHQRHVFGLLWHHDQVWTAGFDGQIRGWDLDVPVSRRVISTLSPGYIHLRFHPQNSSRVAIANAQGILQITDLSDAQNTLVLPNEATQLRDLDFSPDGKLLAVVGKQGRLQLWNTETGDLARDERPLPAVSAAELRAVDWSRDGSVLVVGGISGTIQFVDSTFNSLSGPIETGLRELFSLDLSPDGKTIAVGGIGGVKLFSVENGSELTIPESATSCFKLRWSRGGTKLAVATNRGVISVWDIPSKQQIAELSDTFEPTYAMAWGKDDRRLCTVDARANLILWDVEIGQPTLKMRCGIGEVRATEWSEDGSKLVVGCGSDAILLDAAKGYEFERSQ